MFKPSTRGSRYRFDVATQSVPASSISPLLPIAISSTNGGRTSPPAAPRSTSATIAVGTITSGIALRLPGVSSSTKSSQGTGRPSAPSAPPSALQAERPRRQELGSQSTPEAETIPFEAEHSDRIQNKLCQLLESGKHSDVVFIVTGEDGVIKIPAHRVILASQSEYFDRLLFGEMREAHSGAEIPLRDTPLEAFRILLRYIYSGRMRISGNSLSLKLEVLRLADRFSFSFLKNTFDLHLASVINSSNVLQIFTHADLLHLEYTKTASLSFIDHNAQSILQEPNLLELPAHLLERIISQDTFLVREIEIFHAVQKWLKYNDKRRTDAQDLLNAVRLCEIPPQQLFDEVDPSGLFDRDAIFEAMRIQQKPNWEATLPRGRISGCNLFDHDKTSCQYSSENKANPHWMDGDSSSTWGITVGGTHFDLSEGNTGSYGTRIRKPPTSVLVKLPDVHLVNHIRLQLLVPVTYRIHISNDNKQWRQLFDYSRFICSGEQELYFPKQAIRYIHFSTQSEEKDCKVKLITCSLDGEIPDFALRESGVLAPLKPYPLLTVQSSRRNRNGLPLCQVTFKQPYSVSAMRFKLLGAGATKEGEKVESSVVIYVLAGKGSLYSQVAHLSEHNLVFGSEVQVSFAEKTTNHICVMLKPSEVPGAKRLKLEENQADVIAVDTVQDFSISGLVCWAGNST